MTDLVLKRSLGTHDGTFHADEVTACALLLLFDMIDRDEIVHTRDEEMLARLEFVCDVGGEYAPEKKRFDHHQSDYQGSMSSAGMILKYLHKEKVISLDFYTYLNEALVIGIDDIDNGRGGSKKGHCSFSAVIANFVPITYQAEGDVMRKAFFAALDFALGHLRRLKERYEYIFSFRDEVKQEMDKGNRVLVFDEAMPWLDVFFALGGEKHPAEFLVMPAGPHWKLRGIPPSGERRMEVRQPLPEEWAGLLQEPLRKKSGINGAIFCHKGRFISIWETKEDALCALKEVQGG